jgi:hypothetical protein
MSSIALISPSVVHSMIQCALPGFAAAKQKVERMIK